MNNGRIVGRDADASESLLRVSSKEHYQVGGDEGELGATRDGVHNGRTDGNDPAPVAFRVVVVVDAGRGFGRNYRPAPIARIKDHVAGHAVDLLGGVAPTQVEAPVPAN